MAWARGFQARNLHFNRLATTRIGDSRINRVQQLHCRSDAAMKIFKISLIIVEGCGGDACEAVDVDADGPRGVLDLECQRLLVVNQASREEHGICREAIFRSVLLTLAQDVVQCLEAPSKCWDGNVVERDSRHGVR